MRRASCGPGRLVRWTRFPVSWPRGRGQGGERTTSGRRGPLSSARSPDAGERDLLHAARLWGLECVVSLVAERRGGHTLQKTRLHDPPRYPFSCNLALRCGTDLGLQHQPAHSWGPAGCVRGQERKVKG